MSSSDAHFQVIKLTDFGIAKLAQSELEVEIERFDKDENTLTSSSTLLGAVPYLAPECWTNWKETGQPGDIWALGAIAAHLLLGRAPFGGGRPAIMKMIEIRQSGIVQLAKPRWFGTHPNTTSLENSLWDIVEKCLQADPAVRPSADELVKVLDSLCYMSAERLIGKVASYPIRYQSGGVSTSGFIQVEGLDTRWFFHASDFYGDGGPKPDQKVSFSFFPGLPHPRSTPVLLLK